MKKITLLLASTLLLVSCAGNETASSSNQENVSSEKSISSSVELSDEEKMNKLGELLKSLEGNIQKKKTTQTRVFKYASDGNFDMTVYDEYTTTKYTRGNTYLLDTAGTQIIESSKYTTQTQIYNDGIFFYKIVFYDGEYDQESSATEKFNKSKVQSYYNIGFALEETANFQYMLTQSAKNDLVEYTFENLDGVIDDNKLSYSYSLEIYKTSEGQKVLSQEIKYENTFTIEGDLITKLEQTYVNATYVAQLSESVTATLTTEYTQGEYTEFDGTLLAPSSSSESSSSN